MLCVELIAPNGVTEPVSVCNYLFSSKLIGPKFSEGEKCWSACGTKKYIFKENFDPGPNFP